MKRTAILTAALVALTATAQERARTDISADIVSQYIWRGQDLGHVSLQPTLGLSWRGLSLSAWGSVGLTDSNDTREIDLTLSYTLGGLHFGVTDYWTDNGVEPRYLKYDAHGTNHVFEANVGYDFGVVSLDWYTNFAGADGLNLSGKRAYSSYIEAAAPFRLGGADWTATLGAVPYPTDYYDCSGFAVTRVSLRAEKSVQLSSKFSLPLFAEVSANPRSQHAYLVVGLTLHP